MRASSVLVALAACTPLSSGDDRSDAGVDASEVDVGVDAPVDASVDVFDADLDATPCIVPPTGCPPRCARELDWVGDDVGTGVRLVAADTTLGCDRLWRFDEPTFVEPGVTLTIEPGTIVEARPNAYMLVQSGARLVAEGTRDEPIVFSTSAEHAPGAWPGLLLMGDAPVSDAEQETWTGHIYLRRVDPVRGAYGGTDSAHDCGSLRYVRIEYAGFYSFPWSEEFAALTLVGCGSETSVDYVQLDSNLHAGAYFMGGGFPVRHLVVTEHEGDAISWNLGWSGSLQWVVVRMAEGGRNAIEARMWYPLPAVGPVLANATLIDRFAGHPAFRLTAWSGARIFNVITEGFDQVVSVNEALRVQPYFFDSGYFTLENAILDEGTPLGHEDVQARVAPPLRGNQYADAMLNEQLQPSPDGPANADPGLNLTAFGLETTDYVGAIDPEGENWTEGWTR